MNGNKWLCISLGLIFTTHVFSQDLLFMQEGVLYIDSLAEVYVEGGLVLSSTSELIHKGKLHLGASQLGFKPTSANWTQLSAKTTGGMVLFTGAKAVQQIGGMPSLSFSALEIMDTVLLNSDIILEEVDLHSALLRLNAHQLIIAQPSPQALRSDGVLGGIVSETHPEEKGGYGWVRWNLSNANSNTRFTIPLMTQAAQPIPISFSLGEEGKDTLVVATYPTTPDNRPYPTATNSLAAVQHMRGPLGDDIAGRFIDRFWLIDPGENNVSTLGLTYDPTRDLSGEVVNQIEELRVHPWTGFKWIFFDRGEFVMPYTLEWQDSDIPASIWGMSLSFQELVPSAPIIPTDQEFACFPNPSTGLCKIRFTSPMMHPVSISWYDMHGSLVYKLPIQASPLNNPIKVDLSGLAVGIYNIEVQTRKSRFSQLWIKR